jgi:hypothetical protein
VGPNSEVAPPTSRNASSREIGSTSGVNDISTSRSLVAAARYEGKSGGTNTASGQSRRARAPGIAERTPYRRASYDADITTPRGPPPPTTTGFPASEGSLSVSTDA